MTSNEWGILLSICVSVAVPSTIGWVTVFIMLVKLRTDLLHATQTINELKAEKGDLWRHVERHEGRIDGHDKAMDSIIRHFSVKQGGSA